MTETIQSSPTGSSPMLKAHGVDSGLAEKCGAGVETIRDGKEHCPICGQSGACEWLRAPDRFHGRRHQYTLLRCPSCSLVWTDEPPEPGEMHMHYTDAYDRLISAAGEAPTRWGFRKEALARFKTSGSLLDLGCSSGAFLQLLCGNDWKLFGVEMSQESAKQAQARSGASVYIGTVLDANFSPESFDVITCFDVFEHLDQPRRVMARVVEWLKPGGIFYILIPNIDSAERKVFGTYWHGLELPRHLFHYSPDSLKFLAETAGLRTMSIETRRNPSVGTSLRYVFDDLFQTAGFRRTPVAYGKEASLPWRALRKVMRMTVLRALLAIAPMVGGGESIHAIFQKGEETR
jgi:SAM-dependent methyltransferase